MFYYSVRITKKNRIKEVAFAFGQEFYLQYDYGSFSTEGINVDTSYELPGLNEYLTIQPTASVDTNVYAEDGSTLLGVLSVNKDSHTCSFKFDKKVAEFDSVDHFYIRLGSYWMPQR